MRAQKQKQKQSRSKSKKQKLKQKQKQKQKQPLPLRFSLCAPLWSLARRSFITPTTQTIKPSFQLSTSYHSGVEVAPRLGQDEGALAAQFIRFVREESYQPAAFPGLIFTCLNLQLQSLLVLAAPKVTADDGRGCVL